MSASESKKSGKTCACCGAFKSLNEFRRDISKSDGLRSSCRHCERNRQRKAYRVDHDENKRKRREYFKKHRESVLKSVKLSYVKRRESVLKQKAEYRKKNRAKILEKQRIDWLKNHDTRLAQIRAYAAANREKLNAAKRAARRADPEKEKEIQRRWRLKNPEKAAQLQREGFQRHKAKRLAWEREYRRKSVNRKISVSLRNRLNAVLRGKTKFSSVLTLLGCSLQEFKESFQARFTGEMSWERFLSGKIHIDHIIPCVDFDLSKEDEQRRCFNFSNLQPLWARDNLQKGVKRAIPNVVSAPLAKP